MRIRIHPYNTIEYIQNTPNKYSQDNGWSIFCGVYPPRV